VTDTAPRRLEYMPLDDLLGRRDPRNPKGHADADIRHSLGRFGYTEPVMLDERTGRLIAGHGRIENLDQRRTAGQHPPDGIVIAADGTWTIPVTRGWASRSDEEAAAYLVTSNQLTIKGGWHADPLAAILQEIASATSDGLEGTGFTVADLDLVLAEVSDAGPLDVDAEWGAAGMPDYVSDDLRRKYSVLVSFPSEDDQQAFFELIGRPIVRAMWWPDQDRVGQPEGEQYVADMS
jgi:hypothetical protein